MKMKRGFIFFLLILLLLNGVAYAEEEDPVYVVPIKGEINRATKNYVKDIVDELNRESVEAIIFEIDTHGGLIDEAVAIRDIIVGTAIPTISYVNNKANSAGVLLTISSEKVVMAENASIGSAEPIPNEEKILSYWRSVLRDTAQYRGRDTDIIEAMADKDVVVEEINKGGKLINLTSKEALKHGIADLVSEDYREMLDHFGYNSSNVIVKDEGLQIKLAKYISSPYLSSLLLSIALVGMVIEILTPGFGLGGTISIIGFGLYFGGNILAGNSHWTSLALFVTGLILFVVEGIVPGFGLPGISGIVFVATGIILAMDSLQNAVISLAVAILVTSLVTIILVKLGFRLRAFRSVILSSEHKDEEGYLSVDSMDQYAGKKGISLTVLRPSGFIEIEGDRLDAMSYEGFIDKGQPVEVVKIEGSKIFVRRI